MKGLTIFLAVCAFTTAMVPMEKRAVNTEEEEEMLRIQTTTVTTTEKRTVEICAPQTPCAWSIYKPVVKILEINITNTYCICSSNTSCQINEEDTQVNAFVLRCLPPKKEGADVAGADAES